MSFGGNVPDGPIRALIRRQSTAYTVYRERDGDNMSYTYVGSSEQDNYEELPDKRDLFIFMPDTREVQTDAGDELTGTLRGRALPEVDIQQSDRVQHGAGMYEVEAVDPRSSAASVMFKILHLQRV